MGHLSEGSQRLSIEMIDIASREELLTRSVGLADVCVLRLPVADEGPGKTYLQGAADLTAEVAARLRNTATLIVIGDVADLVEVHSRLAQHLQYQLWIAIRRNPMQTSPHSETLPHEHFGALVFTKYTGQLKHVKTRLAYTYCPACNKTTKDYGGKKHTYHHYGTLISDVWRDFSVDPSGDLREVLERFTDLFGLPHYREMCVFDLSRLLIVRDCFPHQVSENTQSAEPGPSRLILGDCLAELRNLPDNSVDFAFADPPYNLKKDYRGYTDDLDIRDYFAWCDRWITQIARVLRPGGTFALLNIPLWSIRHFSYLKTVLQFQNWIVWDALSFPVRMIMPAHYTILCFSKGEPRPLPGLTGTSGKSPALRSAPAFNSLAPLADQFCLRAQCIARRNALGISDRGILSDIWGDIHRLKHNVRRVDHPCQLPPQLLYRLISIFTQPGETVLDCFNGAGTTTLAAHQLGRHFIGIEKESNYHEIALARHREVDEGIDPFRKEERVLTAKNSPVARLAKRKYEVSKKTLQLEVRRVAMLLGKLPTRQEMIDYGQYAIHYYDNYFSSWGEVCAAARTTGMSETKDDAQTSAKSSQPRLF